MNDFKNQIKKHYKAHHLSEFQLARLSGPRRSLISFLTIPSGIIAACAIFTLVFWGQVKRPSFEERVMTEIVYNHNKNLAVEIKTDNIVVIQKSLPKLDFLISSSSRLKKSEWKIVGARYCSIQGKIAAQIKILKISTGRIHTLYQRKFSPLKESHALIGGANVKVWTEKGLLMGMAGP